jgi:ribonuclease E
MEQDTQAAAQNAPPADPSVATEGSADGTPSTPGSSSTRRRRRRGGRGRGGKKPSSASSSSSAATTDAAAPEEVGTTEAAAKPAAPRPRSRSRPKKPAGTAADDAASTEPARAVEGPTESGRAVAENAGAEGSAAGTAPKRRRRGGRGRGGAGAKKPASASGPDAASVDDDSTASAAAEESEAVTAQRDEAEPDAPTDAGAPATPSRSRSRRRRSGSSATKGPSPQEPAADEAASKPQAKTRQGTLEERIAAGGPTRGIRTTRSRTGGDGRRRREPTPIPPRVTDKVMVITEHGDRDQIAVLEEEVLVQHYVTRIGATSMVGNVYLGRVQNVLPGMEAAFVDVGRGRNGVLYAGEVNYSIEDIDGPAPRIEQLLKPGQAVMVQVTKDPMGGKGARLTANLSLAGRYLVLAPNQDLQGISRRLGDEARKRLKSLLKRVKPPEHGVIVRTAAEGATEEALEADLTRLLSIWNDIQKKAKRGKAPIVLYEEPELTVRVVRDLFTDEEFKSLVTDSPRVHDKVMAYVREVAPDLGEKISLHTGPLSAFEEHRIVEQIHKALDRKVWLPSGGYLIIERTEAMTIIDVNTGKSVGKTNLEETVLNTNLEAARETARQLRLRDIGGIIVVDFIDMLLEKNKKLVEDTMREALAADKTRSQVFEIGPLGLMQVTRKRVSSGLVESFSETCPTCEGRGILLTYDVD